MAADGTDASGAAIAPEQGASIRRMAVADPVRAAGDLAAALEGDLAPDHATALGAIEVRKRPTRISAEDAAELRGLAADYGRATRLRTSTEIEVATSVARKLSTGMGLAVHPTSVRAAARAVVDAEDRLAVADEALSSLGKMRPAAVGGEAPAPIAPDELIDEDALDAAQTRTRAFGLGVAVLGLGLLLAALDVVPWWGAGAGAVLGLLVATVIVGRGRRARVEASDRRESAGVLAAAAAAADRAVTAAAATREANESWFEERARLETTFERAEADRRAARRAWEALVGPGADPYDVEEVMRLRDPQLNLSGDALAVSPTIRTVNAFQRKAAARWKVAWAALGLDDPPEPEDVETALGELGRHRPLVLLEPSPEVEAALAALTPQTQVIIVERAGH